MTFPYIHLGKKHTAATVLAAIFLTSAASEIAQAQGSAVSVSANPSVLAAATLPGAQASISRVGAIGETLHVVVGHSIFLNTKFRLHKIYVTDPNILTSYTMSPNQIIVTAMLPGTSSLILQDENGQAQSYVVSSDVDVDGLRVAMTEAMRGDAVRVDGNGGRVVLSGTVTSDALSDTAVKLATLYSKDVANSLIVTPSRAKQVRLKVRILEVDRSKLTQFGINLFNPQGSNNGASSTGQFPSTATATTSSGTNTLSVSDPLNFLFYNWKYNVGATIKDLESKQVLQILAEPTITTISGQKANFLAGGEFPFPVIQPGGGSGSTASVTIVFRPYGVKLEFTPIVHEDGSILLKVAPEVSALDYTNSVTISGYTIPALATRRAETQVELRSDQSFAISGLLDKRITDVYDRNPGAASIPIIGALFKSKSINHTNTELIVIVTPQLVDPLTDGTDPETPKMPVPTLNANQFDNSLHHKYSADTRSGSGSTLEAEPHKGIDPTAAPATAAPVKASNAQAAVATQPEAQSMPATQTMEPSTTVVVPATATAATLSPTSFEGFQSASRDAAPAAPLYTSAPVVMASADTTPAAAAIPAAVLDAPASSKPVAVSSAAIEPRLGTSLPPASPAVLTSIPATTSVATAEAPLALPVSKGVPVVPEAPKTVADTSTPLVETRKPAEALKPVVAPQVSVASEVAPVSPKPVVVPKVAATIPVASAPQVAAVPVITPRTPALVVPEAAKPAAPVQVASLTRADAPILPATPTTAVMSPVAAAPAVIEKAAPAVIEKRVPAAETPAPVQQAAVTAPVQPVPAAKASIVQVMAISHPEDAEAMVASLKRHGYDVAIKQDPRDSLLHLQMGPYPSRTDAEEIRQKLLSEGYNATVSAIQ